MQKDTNRETPANNDRDLYIDTKTREKIRKHLSDPNDKITDEDIANVNTDMYARPATDEEKKELEEKADEITAKKAPNPWDIRSE